MTLNGKELFLRKWKITVTNPKTKEVHIIESKDGIGLRTQFTITEGSNSNHSQECNLTITNLNAKNRAWIAQENNIVTVVAGYEQIYGEIFTGKIVLGDNLHDKKNRGFSTDEPNKRDDTDWSTEVKCIDNSVPKSKSILSVSFSEKTSVQTIVNKICEELGLKNNINLGKLAKKEKFNNGYSKYGHYSEVIADLAHDYGFEWDVKRKALYFYKPTVGINKERYVINADSGLIGSIDKTEKGYKFKTLLLPELHKGQWIQIKSRVVNGDFIISKLGFKGDSSGDEWYTEFEVISKK